ncbi:hypothetical protein CANINC_001678 [Pichia inconspicua]|uniref:Ribosomal protein L1 n=1 Tax=Pichia inconspicua TaxID=52247 RepID=A0A4V4NFX4_9ASCO|nr:hypothetical protein CANINC_001678 [[Candida] inconspicua]
MPPRKTRLRTAQQESTGKNDNEDSVQTSSKISIKDNIIEKAVHALSEWNKSQSQTSNKKDLFETDDDDIPLVLQVTANKYFSQNNILKPRMLEVPHPIYDLDDMKVCLFVKDDLFDESELERLEILKEKELKNLSQIITVRELKTKYHSYEARRKLLSEFDLFLTDSSIANMIPKLLGKTFFSSPKMPLTVVITEKKKLSLEKLTKNFIKASRSIGFILPMGTNTSFKLGMLGQDLKKLSENISTIAKYLEQFPIRLIQLKLNGSPSIPIYLTKKIYENEDIVSSDSKNTEVNEITPSIYVDGLKELGLDESEAAALFGTKKRAHLSEEDPSQSRATKKNKKLKA